ncbi:hypothetical protein [Methylobacterium sp. SI9]|uniref:hypothetical protein n=1 Tax=Methylobacterium guangdongense TaxID=3138811 RepID=UPI00313E039F
MPRETMTKAEAEAFILERLKAMPGGDAVEVVTIWIDKDDDAEDPVSLPGVGWIGSGDMRAIMNEMGRLHGQLRREYRLVAS